MSASNPRPPVGVQALRIPTLPGLYPLKGIYYFLTHRFLWPLFKARLFTATILSLIVLAILFAFTYLPQVAFLAIFHGRAGAWVNGTFLVLGEGSIIVALLFEAFFVDETQVDVFDAVLVNEGFEDLVQEGRPVKPASVTLTDGEVVHFDPVRRLGKPSKRAMFAPFSCRQIFELVVLLPINFVPVIGVPLYLIGTGWRAGPLMAWRYFQLRGFSRKERKKWIKARRWSYCWFGTIALLLQLVPPLSMLFLLTSAAGSALLNIRFEQRRRMLETHPTPQQQYEDDPV